MPNVQNHSGSKVHPPVTPWPKWTTVAASPILYGMICPLLVLDLFLELYHCLVFPFLGIPGVIRGEYIRTDRIRLPYLSPVQKLACAYCGYANGFLQYAARIAGDTEAYFCPIKHHGGAAFHPPPHHVGFLEFGDAEGWRRRVQAEGGKRDNDQA